MKIGNTRMMSVRDRKKYILVRVARTTYQPKKMNAADHAISSTTILGLNLLTLYNLKITCTQYHDQKITILYQTMAFRQLSTTNTADHSGQMQIASQSGRSSRVNRVNRRSCFVQVFFRSSESCLTRKCFFPARA